jgi:hypothetical protein
MYAARLLKEDARLSALTPTELMLHAAKLCS